jgi:hypothetical protein
MHHRRSRDWLRVLILSSMAVSLMADSRGQADAANPPAAAQPAKNTAATSGQRDVVSLYQTSAILGDKDVLLSPSDVKVIDRKNGLGLTAHAPDWTVYLLMPRAKRMCSYPLAKYTGANKETLGITGGITLNTLPLERKDKETIANIAGVSCETSKTFESKQLKDLERGFAGPRFAKWAQLVIADGGPLDKMPAQAKTILCRFYGLPEFKGKGLPLKCKYVDLSDEMHTLLLTNESKAAKVDAASFDLPTDYAKVADIGKLDDRVKTKNAGPGKIIEVLQKGHKVN